MHIIYWHLAIPDERYQKDNIRVVSIFSKINARILLTKDLEQLEDGIVVVLCKLERIFFLAFFIIMVHLAIHLPRKAMLGGPVHARWIYPIERFLGNLKSMCETELDQRAQASPSLMCRSMANWLAMCDYW